MRANATCSDVVVRGGQRDVHKGRSALPAFTLQRRDSVSTQPQLQPQPHLRPLNRLPLPSEGSGRGRSVATILQLQCLHGNQAVSKMLGEQWTVPGRQNLGDLKTLQRLSVSEKPVDVMRPPLRSVTLVTTSAAKERYRLINERGESLDVELRQSHLDQAAPGLRLARLAHKIQLKAGAGKLISGMNEVSALAATFRDDIDTFAECVLSDSVPTAPAASHLPPQQQAQFDAMANLKQSRNPTRPMPRFDPAASKNTADEAQAILTYGSAVTGNVNTFNWGFANASVLEDQSTLGAKPFAEKPKYDAEVGDAKTRAGFGITGQGVGAFGAFASMGSGIVSLIQLRQKIKDADDSKKARLKLEFAGQLGKTPTSLVEGGARTTAFASGISKAVDSKDGVAAGVASWSGSLGGACSALGRRFPRLLTVEKDSSRRSKLGKRSAVERRSARQRCSTSSPTS